MDYGHFQELLVDRERELEEEIARLKGDIPPIGEPDVRDYTDVAQNDRDTSDAMDMATSLTHTLEEVRDALLRIDKGEYGKCSVCDEPIDEARLEAVPWTTYCLEHQEQQQTVQAGPTL